MNKGIEIVSLTKIEGANLNSDGTEGVIVVLKKVRDPVDMKEYVRVSGQSVKYHLKEILREKEGVEKLSKLSKITGERGAAGKVIVSEGNPVKFMDDDLFGYMRTDKKKRRTAPVRTNGMISIFPYQEDRDFGVRYDSPEVEGYNPKSPEHNIHETEIATNIMRGNFFVETDRVGVFTDEEIEEAMALSNEEREERIKSLLDAIFKYYGGARLTRFFTKTYPEAMVIVFLSRKIPVIGDNFRIKQEYKEGKYIMDVSLLKEILTMFDEYINKAWIGVIENKFANIEEIKELEESSEKIKVFSMKELKEAVKKEKILEAA